MAELELGEDEFEAAKARGAEARRRGPLATSARYDPARDRIVVQLNTGREIDFAPADTQGLTGAAAAELANVEIAQFGLALHWPTLNADHWLPALAQGILGSKTWMQRRRAKAAE
jgi:hypothetical protein